MIDFYSLTPPISEFVEHEAEQPTFISILCSIILEDRILYYTDLPFFNELCITYLGRLWLLYVATLLADDPSIRSAGSQVISVSCKV